MSKRGKKYIEISKKKDTKEYELVEGIKKLKELSYSKFPGTVEMHLKVTLPKDKDPKSIKGSLSLPHGSGKGKKVAVFASEQFQKIAKDAGADIVGLEDLIKDVQAGKMPFDIAIATPDVMPKIAVLGKELGPKGLMPNPKTGTVASGDVLAKTIGEYKKGKLTFSADAQGGIHLNVGKLDLEPEKIVENINKAIIAVEEVFGKPYNQFVKKITLAPTMGPSVKVIYTK